MDIDDHCAGGGDGCGEDDDDDAVPPMLVGRLHVPVDFEGAHSRPSYLGRFTRPLISAPIIS